MWLVPVVIAIGIVAMVHLGRSTAFTDPFDAGLLATLAGVFGGVPLSLWVAGRQVAIERADRERDEAAVAVARQREVLGLIREELVSNAGGIQTRTLSPERAFVLPLLTTEVWDALAASGELRWIEDPALLSVIAKAYRWVRTNIDIESRYLDATHYQGMQIGGGESGSDRLKRYASELDDAVRGALSEAINVIGKALAVS